jgi:hypothetical protein
VSIQTARRQPGDGAPNEKITDWLIKINALIERLTADVPAGPTERNAEQQARWILANVIDWHRREEKAVWWEYFRLAALSAEDLLEERAGLSGLVFAGAAGGTAKAPIHRYRFPPQETEIRGGEELCNLGGAKLGKVEAISFPDNSVDIKKRQDTAALHPQAAFAHSYVGGQVMADPQQLDQPMQGSHPEGTDVSALDHILGGERTISAEKGLFLEETWRLHPVICAYTSELFYDGKLRSKHGLDKQVIKGSGPVSRSGLYFLPVAHNGNQNCSPEEAQAVGRLVRAILAGNATWIDREGRERPIMLDDIVIITPYNAQVFEIQQCLPGARVGTVDKFQGQEAPIAIYSMATSSHADAPRGMEFLYSLNRLNVATSRAKCASIVVGSPQIFEAECRTPRQIQLATAFCRYLEMAKQISVG